MKILLCLYDDLTIGFQEDKRRLEAEFRARMGKKDAELKKQMKELQTLRVRKWMKILLCLHDDLTNGFQEDRRGLESEFGARMGKKDAELNKQKKELQTMIVRNCMKILLYMHDDLTNDFQEDRRRLDAEVQGRLCKKDAEIDRQQRELLVLRVRG